MLIRINFLFGLGLLIMILFYFGFTYLVIGPVSAIAPGWARGVGGAAVLLGVGLTVQILSMAMGGMKGVATYAEGPNATGIVSQAAIVAGHGALGFAGSRWIESGVPPGDAALLLVGALYATGVSIAVLDWRHRTKAAA